MGQAGNRLQERREPQGLGAVSFFQCFHRGGELPLVVFVILGGQGFVPLYVLPGQGAGREEAEAGGRLFGLEHGLGELRADPEQGQRFLGGEETAGDDAEGVVDRVVGDGPMITSASGCASGFPARLSKR